MPAIRSTTSERSQSKHHGTANKKTDVNARDCAQLINQEIQQDTYAYDAFRIHAHATRERGSSATRTEIANAQTAPGEAGT